MLKQAYIAKNESAQNIVVIFSMSRYHKTYLGENQW